MEPWPEPAPRIEPRIPLSKERVLRAAVEFADAHGIEALSMRRLAKELGVEAMSLYNHVANKDEILSGIVEIVASEVEVPSDPRTGRPRSGRARSRRTTRSSATAGPAR